MNKPSKDRRARPTSTIRAEAAIGRSGERLLAGLKAEGAYAFPDPDDDAMLILRCGTGVSLGGGRHPTAAGERLLAADLAAREPGPRGRIVLTPAGRARLRRAEAPEGETFRGQHLDLVVDGAGAERRLRDASESPIAWMVRRRGRDGTPLLDRASFEAGERLRRDIATGMLLPRMGIDWSAERVDGSGPRDAAGASDTMMAARDRVNRAMAAVGHDLSGLLVDLCGHVKGLERIEAERR